MEPLLSGVSKHFPSVVYSCLKAFWFTRYTPFFLFGERSWFPSRSFWPTRIPYLTVPFCLELPIPPRHVNTPFGHLCKHQLSSRSLSFTCRSSFWWTFSSFMLLWGSLSTILVHTVSLLTHLIIYPTLRPPLSAPAIPPLGHLCFSPILLLSNCWPLFSFMLLWGSLSTILVHTVSLLTHLIIYPPLGHHYPHQLSPP